MALWRCPHCATPQAETARCWVCHRSSTACGSCRHFRRAVAGQLGYCGLDARRAPLRGDEIRPCWEAADAALTFVPALPGVGPVWPLDPADDRTPDRSIQFVEVPSPAAEVVTQAAAPEGGGASPSLAADAGFLAPADGEARWSLWGEAEA